MTFASGTTSIGTYEFGECYSLASLTIPAGVTNIGDDAFYDCSGLTNVTIGRNVTTIGAYVFLNCVNLSSIIVDTNNPSFSSLAGVLFGQNQTVLIAYPVGLSGNYIIPYSVTSIGEDAFAFSQPDQCNDPQRRHQYRHCCVRGLRQPDECDPSRPPHQHYQCDLRRLLESDVRNLPRQPHQYRQRGVRILLQTDRCNPFPTASTTSATTHFYTVPALPV